MMIKIFLELGQGKIGGSYNTATMTVPLYLFRGLSRDRQLNLHVGGFLFKIGVKRPREEA